MWQEAKAQRATTSASKRGLAYTTAAEAFQKVAKAELTEKRLTYHRYAGQCFLGVPDKFLAAGAFEHAQQFTYAIELYRGNGNFQHALRLLSGVYDIEEAMAKQVRYACRLFFFVRGDVT